jgi:hypothetical protein
MATRFMRGVPPPRPSHASLQGHLGARESENACKHAKGLERKRANCRKDGRRALVAATVRPSPLPSLCVRPSSASTQPRRVSLGKSNASGGTSTAVSIMTAAADVFRPSFPLPQVSTSMPTVESSDVLCEPQPAILS